MPSPRPRRRAPFQAWPTRPIKLIVPSGPGLSADVLARLMSERISRQLGQPMFVENIAGAAGMVGGQAAARAAPDGYTFYFGLAGALSSNLFLFKSVPYDPVRDFTPVAMVSESGPFVISVHRTAVQVPCRPDRLRQGQSRQAVLRLRCVERLSGRHRPVADQARGIDMMEVPYRATAQVMQDTAPGVTQLMISAVAAARASCSRASSGASPSPPGSAFPALDDVPTVAETLPGFRVDGWLAVVAPAGTPEPIVRASTARSMPSSKSPRLNSGFGPWALRRKARARRTRSGHSSARKSKPGARWPRNWYPAAMSGPRVKPAERARPRPACRRTRSSPTSR